MADGPAVAEAPTPTASTNRVEYPAATKGGDIPHVGAGITGNEAGGAIVGPADQKLWKAIMQGGQTPVDVPNVEIGPYTQAQTGAKGPLLDSKVQTLEPGNSRAGGTPQTSDAHGAESHLSAQERNALQIAINPANPNDKSTRNLDLRGVNFEKMVTSGLVDKNFLKGRDLTGAKLDHANLSGLDLTGTNLTNADLSNATLDHTSGDHTNLTGAKCVGTAFNRASLTNGDFTGADLDQAKFHGSCLTNNNFKDATFNGATSSDAVEKTTGKPLATDFTGSKFQDAHMAGSHLEKSYGAPDSTYDALAAKETAALKAREAEVIAALKDRSGKHPATGLDLHGLDLAKLAKEIEPDMPEYALTYHDFTGANFSGANLTGMHLDFSNLQGANFTGANMEKTDFNGTYGAGTVFKGADLQDARFNGASVPHADFMGANLTNVMFKGGNFSNSKFDGADLKNAASVYTDSNDHGTTTFSGSTWDGAKNLKQAGLAESSGAPADSLHKTQAVQDEHARDAAYAEAARNARIQAAADRMSIIDMTPPYMTPAEYERYGGPVADREDPLGGD